MQYYSQNIEKPMLRATTNAEKGSVAKIKVPKRTVHLHIALPEQQPFKVQFITKDDKSVSTSVVQLGEDKTYTPDMVFQPDTTYLFRLNTTFEGEIVINQVCNQTMSVPIIASKEPFSLMLGYDEKKPLNPYIDKPLIKLEPQEGEETIILEIGQKFFEGLKDGGYVVNSTLQPYVQKFIDDDIVHSVVLGMVADSSQAYADVRKSFWDLARGLRFEIKVINSKRYIILKGWRHLRTYFVGTKYSASNPKLAGLDPKSLKHVTSVKGLMGSNIVTVVIGSLLTTIDFFLDPKTNKDDISDLFVSIFTGIAKTLLAAFVAAIIVAAFIASFALVITSATLVIGATIILGIAGSAGLNWADAKFGWTAKIQEEVNETQAWIEHEYKLFRRSMALFSDLVSGEAKPISAYNSYLE